MVSNSWYGETKNYRYAEETKKDQKMLLQMDHIGLENECFSNSLFVIKSLIFHLFCELFWSRNAAIRDSF